jgi:hypothetical protein
VSRLDPTAVPPPDAPIVTLLIGVTAEELARLAPSLGHHVCEVRCEVCDRPYLVAGQALDELRDSAAKTGKELLVLCRPCHDPGHLSLLYLPREEIDRAVRRHQAERN